MDGGGVVIKVGAGVEAEVSNEEKNDARGKEGDTDTTKGNERSVVIGPAVDLYQEVAYPQQHHCHHVPPRETVLSGDIVEIIITGTNEGTKEKATEKKEGSRPNDIVRGGNDLILLRHRPIPPFLGVMISTGGLNRHASLSRCSMKEEANDLCREKALRAVL
mmetsp:Transcript_3444/g.5245  ORF Transcript_3444/g.5245 Transcript_3444/m.5245 type:complete len:162 (+) Transcript_3444:731-1216(+)